MTHQTNGNGNHVNGDGYPKGLDPNGHTAHAPDGKHNGDAYRDYVDDRNATDDQVVYTTSNGVPYPHPYESQRMGENGPLLLQDFHLVDLLSHFDRERIPERVVHAKGAGAHGYYTTTDSLEDLCLADIFKQGKACPITVRFSTVGGESGSHDCARDPRGFSVKFRTEEVSCVLHSQEKHCLLLLGKLGCCRQQHTCLLSEGPSQVPSLRK